jgi:hypothetical protein
VKVGKKIRKGIRGMTWKFLPDGGIKLGELNSHNIIKLSTYVPDPNSIGQPQIITPFVS